MYLDAAHGGWLGWENNAQDFAALVSGLGVADKLRGFSTNVANYQPLGQACPTFDWCLPSSHPGDACCEDPCHLESQYNPGVQEHQYVQVLAHYVSPFMPSPHFVIDTGRNGVDGMRSNCANWCNVRGSGVGRQPTADTDLPALIDAYFWLKTPGESDGCTQTLPSGAQCTRYDSFCGSADSLGNANGEPPAPVAGLWYDFEVQQLAKNANFNATRR
jgi:cellulose 1,4-beta-cellobiosidase